MGLLPVHLLGPDNQSAQTAASSPIYKLGTSVMAILRGKPIPAPAPNTIHSGKVILPFDEADTTEMLFVFFAFLGAFQAAGLRQGVLQPGAHAPFDSLSSAIAKSIGSHAAAFGACIGYALVLVAHRFGLLQDIAAFSNPQRQQPTG